MVQLYVEGKIDSLRIEKTKMEKDYKKIFFRRDLEGGGFDSFIVIDYQNREWNVGDNVKIPVFISSYKNKDGVVAVQYLAKKEVMNNVQVKQKDIRV